MKKPKKPATLNVSLPTKYVTKNYYFFLNEPKGEDVILEECDVPSGWGGNDPKIWTKEKLEVFDETYHALENISPDSIALFLKDLGANPKQAFISAYEPYRDANPALYMAVDLELDPAGFKVKQEEYNMAQEKYKQDCAIYEEEMKKYKIFKAQEDVDKAKEALNKALVACSEA